nr:MAG TPA: hypothetical protein [Caudoviricetes sp.]
MIVRSRTGRYRYDIGVVRNTGDFIHRGSAACGRAFIEGRDSDCC